MNCVNFDFNESLFTEKMMNIKDKKDNLSREGSGRVGIYKATKCTHCYTLECNYATGKVFNSLSPFYNSKNQNEYCYDNINKEYNWITNNKDIRYKQDVLLFDIELWKDIGSSTAISILDLYGKNE